MPMAWIGSNSGVSRNRPERSALTDRKFHNFAPPNPNVPSSEYVPNELRCATKLPFGFWPRPERVTAFTIRLVLSPNSAGGVPVINSMD